MPRSMTGYGSGQSSREGRVIKAECRSVNHRYLDLSIRLPSWLSAFEPLVRSLAQEELGRGRVEIRVTDESGAGPGRELLLDQELAEAYAASLDTLAVITGKPALDPCAILASLPGIFSLTEGAEDETALADQITEAVKLALEALNRTRSEEGGRLALDLLEKSGELRTHLASMATRAPEVPGLYREKLLARAEELFEEERPEWYSDQRLFAETALFADRASIDEEITRLAAHVDALEEGLASDLPTGRQLDFLIQEIFREINTIGSKANDLELTQTVVAAKTLVEKIREQVQNLE